MPKTPKETLRELLDSTNSITGFDLSQLVGNILSQENDDSFEYAVAEQLWNDYFADTEGIFKPAKFAYYKLVETKNHIYSCKRDQMLSPRGGEYFVPDNSSTNEYDYRNTLRTVISNKQHILGKDLKELIAQTISHEKTEENDAFSNFSVQLASYINQYFLEDGNIRDDVWYTLRTKEYGTVIVLRDQKRSPRTTKVTEKNA